MSDAGPMDPLRAARAFVDARFPDALAAILGGSAATEHRTATSDLDLVVLFDDSHSAFRETTERDGWVVEAFCHTAASFAAFADRETTARRSPLLHMCGEGVIVLDRTGLGQRIHDDARAQLRMGPPPLPDAELDDVRYRISDLLDDLAGSQNHDETLLIANLLLTTTGQLILALDQRWQSTGKWLVRRLRDADPDTCEALLRGYRDLVCGADATGFTRTIESVLGRAGGRLLAGYHRTAPPETSAR